MAVHSSNPPHTPSATRRAFRIPAWRWGLATLLAVVFIVGGSYVARSVVKRLRQPASVAAPALPPLPVAAVTLPDASYEYIGLDTAAGRLAALTAPSLPLCEPVGPCPPPRPALDRFVVLDGQTAQPLASTPLSGDSALAADAVLLLVDDAAHRAYAVAPHAVVIFSTEDGTRVGGYALPGELNRDRPTGGGFWLPAHALILVGGGQLVALDAATGHILHRQSVTFAGGAVDGPALASGGSAKDSLYVLKHGSAEGPALLLAFDPNTLAQTSRVALPVDGTLGPVENGSATVFGADGQTYRVSGGAGGAVQRDANAPGALALGRDATTGHTFVARADGIVVEDQDGARRAALPLLVAWTGFEPLPVDPQRHLVYLPTDNGAVVIARDTPVSGGLTPGGAVLLARQALPQYLPDTNQDPPFLAAATFWPGVGADGTATRHLPFYIHYSDQGWTGPYAGTARTQVAPRPGRGGAYRVTFTIGWYQLFQRTHAWALDVSPSGAVSFVSEGGDALP